MKQRKILTSLVLMLVLIVSMVIPVLADDQDDNSTATTEITGTITITNAVEGQTYTIYRMLDLESYDTTANLYSYKVAEGWESFFAENGAGAAYVTIEDGYVKWDKGTDAETTAAFAKAALGYAKKNSIDSVDSKTNGNASTVEFTGLKLGYYLIDSSLGTLCLLDTTNPNVKIDEKNGVPTNEKTVKENSTGKYVGTNDAQIGSTVEFKSTITAQAGAENYVFHDKMSEGLTFGGAGTVTVTLAGKEIDPTVGKEGEEGYRKNYEISLSTEDECTFEIKFSKEFCDGLSAGQEIVITYEAVLNENAVIGSTGNLNESKLSYGDKSSTLPSKTTTHTWKVDFFKYTVRDNENKPLAGAEFTLSLSADGSNPIKLVSLGEMKKDETSEATIAVYRVAKAKEEGTITTITTDASGEFRIQGLDSGTYYLTETKQPAGYNKLQNSQEIVIDAEGKINTTEENENGVERIMIENKTGTELPSTGGMGTTIFYVLGSVMVIAAGVLLVVKKRMNAER